jgi:hypothetical protein
MCATDYLVVKERRQIQRMPAAKCREIYLGLRKKQHEDEEKFTQREAS